MGWVPSAVNPANDHVPARSNLAATWRIQLSSQTLAEDTLKITFFGLTLSSSWGNGHATPYRALFRALRAQGHELTFFEKDVPYYAKHRDFSQVEYCDLVLYPNWAT